VKAISKLSALAVGLLALPAGAVVTSTWTVETYQQFDAGDATNAFITSTGELRPGWDTKRTAIEGDAVWSALRLADGSVLLGSDAGGAIFRLAGDASKKLVALPGAMTYLAVRLLAAAPARPAPPLPAPPRPPVAPAGPVVPALTLFLPTGFMS